MIRELDDVVGRYETKPENKYKIQGNRTAVIPQLLRYGFCHGPEIPRHTLHIHTQRVQKPVMPISTFHHVSISESRKPNLGSNSTNMQFPEMTTGLPSEAMIISYTKIGTYIRNRNIATTQPKDRLSSSAIGSTVSSRASCV